MDKKDIISWVAICFNTCFYCLQALPFLKVLTCKLSYELTPIVFVSTLYVDSFSWWIFGKQISCQHLELGHFIGGCILLTLIGVYIIFELKYDLIDSILNLVIICLGSLVLYKGLLDVIIDINKLGLVCLTFKLITFCVPSMTMYKIVKEKTHQLISLRLTCIYSISCISWLLYSLYYYNFYLRMANGIGLVLSMIQFILYFKYKNKTPIIDVLNTSSLEIASSSEDKKVDSNSMNLDEEKAEKSNEKPVKIITKIDPII